jgi:hypothetical protein
MVPIGVGAYDTWSAFPVTAPVTPVWQDVDELPPDGTNYALSTLTIGNTFTCALQTLVGAGISGVVKSVKGRGLILKDNAATCAARLVARSATTDLTTAADLVATGTYAEVGLIMDTDPATAASWTMAGLDTLELGMVERSNTAVSKTRCAAVHALVFLGPLVRRQKPVKLHRWV